jgi:hypothetical protein
MPLSGKFLLLLKKVMALLGKTTNPYRPERHYMRGPGPASQRKRAAAGAASPRS